MKVAAVVLAAGESARMGRPKQLLPFQHTSLISRIVTTCLHARVDPVIVVSGAFADEIASEVSDTSAHIIYNPDWKEGMASSIRAGINALKDLEPSIEGAIFLVADQPFVSSDLLDRMLDDYLTSHKTIIACRYGQTSGTPVLFAKSHFDSLKCLNGAEGAKKLLNFYPDEVQLIPFPLGEVDIDTWEDYKHLIGPGRGDQHREQAFYESGSGLGVLPDGLD